MIAFIKDYFLHLVPGEEKKQIRQSLIRDDHKGYVRVMVAIFLFQVAMLIRSVVTYGIVIESKPWVNQYRTLYILLAVLCIIASVVVEVLFKHRREFGYFIAVSIMMILIDLWGVGISLLDSHSSSDLTTYAYVTIAIAVFMIIEPWVAAVNLVFCCVVLNVAFVLLPNRGFSSSILVNSLSILALALIGSLFNFYRRIKKLKLEMEIVELNKILERKAEIDELTGLYNRHHLTNQIDNPLNVGARPSGVMMFDIDYFKNVNDEYGHLAGDEVLRKLGEIVLQQEEENDYSVRYGGEEFLVYLENTTDEEISQRAERLRKTVEDAVVELKNGSSIKFTISVGTALARSGISYAGLIDESDIALYEAKKNRNCVCAYKK